MPKFLKLYKQSDYRKTFLREIHCITLVRCLIVEGKIPINDAVSLHHEV